MIKPASLWAFIKTADEKTAGRVMLALAGREGELSPPLNPSEICLVSVIKQDGVWMDENIAKRKQRVAEAVKAHRERKKAAAEKAQAEYEPSAPKIIAPIEPPPQPIQPPPEDLPYIPIPQKAIMPETPELKEVLSVSPSMGVPEGYARWWYKQMEAGDWHTTKGLKINRRNWRAQLKAWHNRATPDEIDKINREMAETKKSVIKISARDWDLCEERCANYCQYRCAKGVKIPPPADTPPRPPEECPHYYALNRAKNGAGGASRV